MNNRTAFYLPLSKLKQNLKLAYAVYSALPSKIIKYTSFEYICTFILYYIYIHDIHLISVTLLQNDQNGKHIQKGQRSFFLLNTNILHIT